MLCEEAVVYENEEVRAEATALNYYHLSPHIRAQVLCAPPRTRYVFLSARAMLHTHQCHHLH